jgi:hypothetical protein
MITLNSIVNRPDFPFHKELFLRVISWLPKAFAQTLEASEDRDAKADKVLLELDNI